MPVDQGRALRLPRTNDETSAALIEKLTDALCDATYPGLGGITRG